jgi:large subunit ribosomal protein L23
MAKDIKSFEIIKSPRITEKSTTLSANNQVVFMVANDARKPQIKAAVEDIFGVKVKAVNVINNQGKKKVFRGYRGERSSFKKAIITLESGQTIDITAGVK